MEHGGFLRKSETFCYNEKPMRAEIIFFQRDGGFESNFGAHETKSRAVLITTILVK